MLHPCLPLFYILHGWLLKDLKCQSKGTSIATVGVQGPWHLIGDLSCWSLTFPFQGHLLQYPCSSLYSGPIKLQKFWKSFVKYFLCSFLSDVKASLSHLLSLLFKTQFIGYHLLVGLLLFVIICYYFLCIVCYYLLLFPLHCSIPRLVLTSLLSYKSAHVLPKQFLEYKFCFIYLVLNGTIYNYWWNNLQLA